MGHGATANSLGESQSSVGVPGTECPSPFLAMLERVAERRP